MIKKFLPLLLLSFMSFASIAKNTNYASNSSKSNLSEKIDDKLFLENDFSKIVAQKLIALKPMNDFLNRALETED